MKRRKKKLNKIHLDPIELSIWDDEEECDCDPEDEECDCDDSVEEFKILSIGDNKAWHMGAGKSSLKYTEVSGAYVMQFYEDSGMDKLPIDYEHNSFNPQADSAPAAGWFIPEHRPGDGLYATKITWTDKARAMLKSKEYRFYSPVVQIDDDDNVVSLLNIALTNNPALRGIQPLVAAKMESNMEQKIDKEDVVEVIKDEEKERLLAFRTITLTTLEVDAEDKAVGKLSALVETNKQLSLLIEQLKSQLIEANAEKVNLQASSLIDAAVKEGKVPPAKKEEVVNLYKKIGHDGLVSYLSMLPSLIKINSEINSPNNNVEADSSMSLSSTELEVARKFGFDPKEFAKHKIKCKSLKALPVEIEEDK